MSKRTQVTEPSEEIQLPLTARNRILYLWFDSESHPNFWGKISSSYVRKKGKARLTMIDNGYEPDNVAQFFATANDREAIDFLEFVLSQMEDHVKGLPTYEEIGGKPYVPFAIYDIKKVLKSVNEILQEEEVSLRYMNGKLVKNEEDYLYQNVVDPASQLLLEEHFDGASEEFKIAHEHYAKFRYKECITECNKAFESTMKAICDQKKWKYDKKAQAKTLIEVLLKNGLIGSEQESFFGAVRSLLESGTPTLRNRNSAHGQGIAITHVPGYIAQYALNLTAANIVLLVNAYRDRS